MLIRPTLPPEDSGSSRVPELGDRAAARFSRAIQDYNTSGDGGEVEVAERSTVIHFTRRKSNHR